MGQKLQLVFVLCAYLIAITAAQDSVQIDYPTLNPSWSYCYEFTWFGPEYNNITGYNGTCDDYVDDTRAGENIPCIAPLVISNDGTYPDMNYLWDNHRASVVCLRSASQACVKYTYLYNDIITNQTHMCATVRTEKKEVSSGCYKEKKNGYTIEMCVCKSGIGLSQQPCNRSVAYSATEAIFIIGLFIYWIGK